MLTLKARYVFPASGPPIPDGSITIDGDKIIAVGQTRGSGEVRDLGNVAILPGLVNAHAHLDFSELTQPLGESGIAMADWIRRVREYRRKDGGTGTNSVILGICESLRSGVTTMGDIAQPDWPIEEAAASPLQGVAFQELIAPTAERVAAAIELAKSHIGRAASGSNWRPGLSPHAPFSVHSELLAAIVEMSAREQVPVAMHLAESREELELLRHGSGPLGSFLEEIGAWDATAIRTGSRPLDYLRQLATAHRALVIHGNYLDNEEMAFLGANSSRMTAVYCPRTNDWFARDTYPLERMFSAGVVVALGTDGRGSSPDLSLLAEMRLVFKQHPSMLGQLILRMGTIHGAMALGCQDRVGTIEPGKQADLAIVALPDRDAADPHELLFDSREPVVGCYISGKPTTGRKPQMNTDEHS